MERRLTAILAADMVGYSRLTEADEEGTLARLKMLRSEFIDPKIEEHSGRVVKLMGDGALVEFASIVDAVRCAVEIQRGIATRNAKLPVSKRIEFRIGINLGDVVAEANDILGDGVNIAARLEGLAEPGGICISGTAYDQVKTKLDAGFESLGEQQVKNISEPVRVYRILINGSAARRVVTTNVGLPRRTTIAAVGVATLLALIAAFAWWQPWEPDTEPMVLPLSDKPSVAVLSFNNVSSDPDQAYFADGITEDLITDLAKFTGLKIISRTSTSAYKDKQVDVREISRDLGVQYVLEGSVEKSSEKIRVTAQLIDAATGSHLWAERYDRELIDLLAIRDDIRRSIVGAITGETGPLVSAEMRRATQQPEDLMRARDLYYRALSYHSEFNKEANVRERDILERSIELDPNNVAAHALLAWTHWRDNFLGWGDDPDSSRDLAIGAAEKAVALDSFDYRGHWALGSALALQGNYAAAALQYERAFELNPHDPDMRAQWGDVLLGSGRTEEAIAQVKLAMALNPHYPEWYLHILADSYFRLGQYDDVVRTGGTFVNPDLALWLMVVASYGHLERITEAATEIRKILKTYPGFAISKAQMVPNWSDEYRKSFLEGLRKAGLPE